MTQKLRTSAMNSNALRIRMPVASLISLLLDHSIIQNVLEPFTHARSTTSLFPLPRLYHDTTPDTFSAVCQHHIDAFRIAFLKDSPVATIVFVIDIAIVAVQQPSKPSPLNVKQQHQHHKKPTPLALVIEMTGIICNIILVAPVYYIDLCM